MDFGVDIFIGFGVDLTASLKISRILSSSKLRAPFKFDEVTFFDDAGEPTDGEFIFSCCTET